MKIGILTYPNSPSLGASLQMFALYRVLEQMGHDPAIINYDPPNLHNKKIKAPLTTKQKIEYQLKQKIISLLVPQAGYKFSLFERQMLKEPTMPTSSAEKLSDQSHYYDRIIVGSDQVWNEKITGHDFNFYLEFCNNPNKKVSYAASFGNNDVPDEEKERIAKLLSEFKAISVRETTGQEIVERLIGKKPPLVLDPTLLINADELREQMIESDEKKYVLFYTIKPSAHLKAIAQSFADKHGFRLVDMNARVKDRFIPNKHPAFGVGPREFLGLVNGAEYVFTNSFHGVAISVAFHKPFYVEYSSDTNSRLTNMIDLFDLPQCIVDDQTVQRAPISINYNIVEKRLGVLREESLAFLREALEE